MFPVCIRMALQMQYNGLRRGYRLGAPHFDYDASRLVEHGGLASSQTLKSNNSCKRKPRLSLSRASFLGP